MAKKTSLLYLFEGSLHWTILRAHASARIQGQGRKSLPGRMRQIKVQLSSFAVRKTHQYGEFSFGTPSV